MILRIECPECQQSFEVDEELKGRTVECGSCEHRFQVTDRVLAEERARFYPDESRKNTDLSRFGRVPVASAPVEFRTMEYDASAKTAFVGPMPPVRIFAAVSGILLLVICAMVLYFGTVEGSAFLRDIEKSARYALAGFFGLVALLLLVWGMSRYRVPAFLLGVLGAVGLGALAHYMPVPRTPKSIAGNQEAGEAGGLSSEEEEEPETSPFFPGITEELISPQEVMKLTRWDATVLPVVSSGEETWVAALWIREMEEFHRLQIEKYLKQSLELPQLPYFRTLTGKSRDGGIFVMSGVPLDLDRVEAVVERLGEVEQVIPELRVIQLQINPDALGGDVSAELNAKLINPEGEAFYALNFKELISLDKGRVKDAAMRLSNAQPLRMRKDITVRLVGLLGQEDDSEMLSVLAEALNVWSEKGDGADVVLIDLIQKMRSGGKKVPDEMMGFLAERKFASAAPLLVELWADDAIGRQRFLFSYGAQVAPLITKYLGSSDMVVSRSAARVLGQVGTKSELPAMRQVLETTKDEALKISLQQAISQVERR